jgi:hypothetical protein
MTKTEINGTFNEILALMNTYATATTENNLDYLYLIMDRYKLVYEVDMHILRKLYKQPFRSLSGGKITTITHKPLARTNIKKKTHELVKLECSEIELMTIHLEVKHKYETINAE